MTPFGEKAAHIKMILLDVDGVMTDGGVTYEEADTELKRFDIQDGMGIAMAVKAGIRVGILTGRTSPMVERRARELSMAVVKQGFIAKLDGWNEILREQKIDPSEIAYMGDDVQDLPVLWRAGFSAAPGNAVSEVKSEVDYVCQRTGGHGAVRELIDLVLAEKGIKAEVIAAVTGKKP
jgi:3-deoxy-D-manno-octulosonate 8-phosphate phosphatase (KDO 8-P phosphatase)